MIRLRSIDSIDLPELAPYRTLRRQEEHRRAGLFVAEGAKVVCRLLESRFEVISVLCPEDWVDRLRRLIEPRPEQVDLFVAPKQALQDLTGFSMYQGLLGLGRVPEPWNLDRLVKASPKPALYVACDGISNAENIGVLARNALALGAHGLVTGASCCSPFLRRSVRSSMGALFQLPVVEGVPTKDALQHLRSEGVRIYAAALGPGSKPISEVRFEGDCCLVMGSEGMGLGPEVLGVCDHSVEIPMHHGVDSLNVACASAIFLFEAQRQRPGSSLPNGRGRGT